ncbi:MAG: polysaccharide pyruvyl transferase family protein [Pirellulales bacterium]|jgi:polysaccharide pyruvyl transferase WcaK-like protein
MAPAATSNRPALILSGFFGRGNCGDEALLQAQFERFSPDYEIVVSVDERGAYDGFWNWYPYDRCRIVHQGNLGVVTERDVIGLHVGGGGLPHGFNAAQVVRARSYDKPAFLTGVDAAPPVSPSAASAVSAYLSLFDFISVRSAGSWRTMRALDERCHLGGDWALALPTDGPQHVPKSGSVVLVIREFPPVLLAAAYLDSLARLVDVLGAKFGKIVLLPFCPEDERFLEHLPPTEPLPREIHWWNPRRVQREIAAAELVVSLGRLHPLIFAGNVEVPAVFAEPLAGDSRWPVCTKAKQLCEEHGWPYFASTDDLTAALCEPHPLQPARFAPGYRERFHEQTAKLEALLRADFVKTGGLQ